MATRKLSDNEIQMCVVPKRLNAFYNRIGWRTIAGVTEDAARWEDLSQCAAAYVSACRMRVAKHIPPSGDNLLDMASGPIQYPEYQAFSRNYKKRYCVDLSLDALKDAEHLIGAHGVYLHGNFLDMEMDRDFFDCSISLHTIYHIDKEHQEKAVRKLIDVTKSGRPIIIVYSNPNVAPIVFKLVRLISIPTRIVRRLRRLMKAMPPDAAIVNIYPWRSLTSDDQKLAFPDNYTPRE